MIFVYHMEVFSYGSSASDQDMMPGKGDYRPSISSTGSVSYNFPTVLSSACSVNVRYFPFDTQRCNLQFGSWSHHGSELDIESKHPSGTSMYTFLNVRSYFVFLLRFSLLVRFSLLFTLISVSVAFLTYSTINMGKNLPLK